MAVIVRKGSKFLIQWGFAVIVERVNTIQWRTVAETIVSNDSTFENNLIEVTDKGKRTREFLEFSGVQSLDISVNGYFSTPKANDQTDYIRLFVNSAVNTSRAMLRLLDEAGNTWTGHFIVENFEQTGTVDSAHEFSCTLKSTGDVTYEYNTP